MPLDRSRIDYSNPHHLRCLMMEELEEEFIYQKERRYLLGLDDKAPAQSLKMPTAVAVARKESPLRWERIAKERCQTVAKLLWKQNPKYKTAQLSVHPDILNKDIGGSCFAPRTVYDWIREVDPREQKNKIGRPAKKLKLTHNNLRS